MPDGRLLPIFKEYRDPLPYDVEEFKNVFLNTGINEIWNIVAAVVTGTTHTFAAANTTLGVGENATAAAAGDTDLKGATKTYKTASSVIVGTSQQMVIAATFTTSDANYVWQEVVTKHGTSAISINRGVLALGTKTSAASWTLTAMLTIA